MNVYDFDKTIFRVDSTAAFYRHCLRRHPKIARHWPIQLVYALRYLAGRIDKTRMKQCFYRFLPDIPELDREIAAFWAQNMGRIESWYLAQRRPDDVIISASPYFLLSPLLEGRLAVGALMASNVDPSTGRYHGINCHGQEKVRRYQEVFGATPVDNFYSDSLSDAPMARLARHAFLVKKGTLSPWPKEQL